MISRHQPWTRSATISPVTGEGETYDAVNGGVVVDMATSTSPLMNVVETIVLHIPSTVKIPLLPTSLIIMSIGAESADTLR